MRIVQSNLRAWLIYLIAVGIGFAFVPDAMAVEDKEVDDAVVMALKFLARVQNNNGSWGIDANNESTAETSLAVMAFLAAGHCPGEGPYGAAINRGVKYVLDHQLPNGLIVEKQAHGAMYGHGISALMLSEVAGMTDKETATRIRRQLETAIELILKAQMVKKPPRDKGGWRYQHATNESDLSVTGWQLLALRAAKDIGCDVPAQNIDLAVGYVKRCASGRGFGYQPGNGPTSSMTAAGVLALQVCDHHDDPEVHAGMAMLQQQPMRQNDGWYFYGAYYQSISAYKYGGADWELTKATLFKELLSIQDPTGCWQSPGGMERNQGLVYSTSLVVLALTVEYGYLPIYQR
jgi:hypothetical protein